MTLAALDSLLHRLRVPHRFMWRLCDAYDLSLGVPDTPENFPRRHGWVRLQHVYTESGQISEWTPCSHCGQPFAHSGPCLLVRADGAR